ncbi:hypothetical protein BT96DRAFT_1017350 [Gymnopus androsaceus JB14]|uniref:Uncharacterized protein n=1 Tax=Gymnopus androsaceus JB14 TaxID=1447944 RepID=A0A6A4HYV4_9AGAR|nr:hypothetical protein BT96DRAFT_1017350 [Gymnopus androsaceus JB14]
MSFSLNFSPDNEDRDKAELLTGDLERECVMLKYLHQILTLSQGGYASAKADVGRLGHPLLPSLQSMLERKSCWISQRTRNSNTTSGLSAAATLASSCPTSPVSTTTTTITTKYRHYPSSASYLASQSPPVPLVQAPVAVSIRRLQ